MQIAFSSLACPGWSVEQIAAAAREHSFAGIEWRLADGELLKPKTTDDVWTRIAECGVPAVCLDTSCQFVRATNEERVKAVDYAAAMGEYAARIGAPFIRVFGGPAPDGMTFDDVIEPARDALSLAAARVPDGVRILVETHDAWSTGAGIMRLIGGVDVGVVWDIAHTVREFEAPADTIDVMGLPDLVHVKDAAGEKLVPLGEGTVPLSFAMSQLFGAGYDGWLSFEWEKLWHPELDEPELALPAASNYLHELVGRHR